MICYFPLNKMRGRKINNPRVTYHWCKHVIHIIINTSERNSGAIFIPLGCVIEYYIHDHLIKKKCQPKKWKISHISKVTTDLFHYSTSIPRLCASLMRSLNSFIASWPQFPMPAEEYRIIGEKKLTVEYPQKFILDKKIWVQDAIYRQN